MLFSDSVDTALLSRIQFAFTVAFHILWPTFTIGLAWFLVFCEWMHLRSQKSVWMRIYRFWIRIYAMGFGMGVVSGIVLSYQFGTNWAGFINFSAPVLGPLLALEVLTAFFLEAGFLGVMLFGYSRVGPRLHFAATLLVAIGVAISAFWILSANSFMQTPVADAFRIEKYPTIQGSWWRAPWIWAMDPGRMVANDWWQIIFNPSLPYRFAHMMIATFLSVAFVVAGVSAWQLRRGLAPEVTRRALQLGVIMAAIAGPLQLFVGDLHGLNTLKHQPIKVAAMEGNWERGPGRPFLLFAIPDRAQETNHFEVGIPKLASLILTHDMEGEIPGLKDVPASERPPVAQVFWSFRIMVGLGLWMIVLALWAAFRLWRGRLTAEASPLTLRLLTWSIPAGFVATIAGWCVTEIGRQPWLIYGYQRTLDAYTRVPVQTVAVSLAAFIIVYGLILTYFIIYMARTVAKGPPADTEAGDPPVIGPHLTATDPEPTQDRVPQT